MSFSIEFYSTDKDQAVAEILRLNSTGAIPLEVAVFLATGVRNLHTDTYERREDSTANTSVASCNTSFTSRRTAIFATGRTATKCPPASLRSGLSAPSFELKIPTAETPVALMVNFG